MPQYKPLGATSNPNTSVLDATENHVMVSAVKPTNRTPMNDPG